jgi:hypothetical protein
MPALKCVNQIYISRRHGVPAPTTMCQMSAAIKATTIMRRIRSRVSRPKVSSSWEVSRSGSLWRNYSVAQPVARARKRVDYAEHRARWRCTSNAGNFLADAISQGVAHRLKRGAGKDADAARMPLRWRHTVERNRVGIAAVAAKLLNFPSFDDLVALCWAQKKIAIVTRNASIGHRCPLLAIDRLRPRAKALGDRL